MPNAHNPAAKTRRRQVFGLFCTVSTNPPQTGGPSSPRAVRQIYPRESHSLVLKSNTRSKRFFNPMSGARKRGRKISLKKDFLICGGDGRSEKVADWR